MKRVIPEGEVLVALSVFGSRSFFDW